jgi:hypothetical protein
MSIATAPSAAAVASFRGFGLVMINTTVKAKIHKLRVRVMKTFSS